MAAFNTQSFSESAFSIDAFSFAFVPPPPVPVVTTKITEGRPRYEQRHREWLAEIEKQNADDLEVVQVLTEFLSRM